MFAVVRLSLQSPSIYPQLVAMASSTASAEKMTITHAKIDQASASVTNESGRNDDPEKSAVAADGIPIETDKSNWNKPLRFYLAFFCLLLMVLMVSIDATALGVAIPVSRPRFRWRYQ